MRHGLFCEAAHSRAARSGIPSPRRLRRRVRKRFHSFQRTCLSLRLSHSSKSENGRSPSANEQQADHPAVKRLMAWMRRSIETPQVRAVS